MAHRLLGALVIGVTGSYALTAGGVSPASAEQESTSLVCTDASTSADGTYTACGDAISLYPYERQVVDLAANDIYTDQGVANEVCGVRSPTDDIYVSIVAGGRDIQTRRFIEPGKYVLPYTAADDGLCEREPEGAATSVLEVTILKVRPITVSRIPGRPGFARFTSKNDAKVVIQIARNKRAKAFQFVRLSPGQKNVVKHINHPSATHFYWSARIGPRQAFTEYEGVVQSVRPPR